MRPIGFSSVADKATQPAEQALPESELTLPGRRRSLKHVAYAIALIYVLLLSLIIGGAAVLISRDRDQELRRAEAELGSITRALEEHVARNIGQIDTVLEALGKHISENGGPHRYGERALHELSSEWLMRLPQATSLNTYSKLGEQLSSSLRYPLEQQNSLPDSVTGLLASAPDAPLLVGTPLRTTDAAAWQIPLIRRMNGFDGGLEGYLTAALSP